MTIKLDTLWGRGLAVIAVGAASIVLAGCSLLGGGGGDTTTDTPTGEGESTDVFTIKVGDCLNDGGVDGEVSEVPTVDCAEPHDSEAYKSIIMEDGDYPGEDAVLSQADTDCNAAFTDFVGVTYDESVLTFAYYYPTEASWEQGDREILCLIYDEAGKTTGSLAGAAK